MGNIYRKFNSGFIQGRTFRIFVSAFSLFAVVLLLQYVTRANAQISSFYPTSCLGGWQNVERAIGFSDASTDDASSYNDENSASVFNSVAEIFCGGFHGEIPEDTFHKNIILKFSWAAEPPALDELINETTNESTVEIPEEIGEEVEETLGETTVEEETQDTLESENTGEELEESEPVSEVETLPEPEVEIIPETQTEEPVSFIYKSFFSIAHAEEITEEEIVEETIPAEEGKIDVVSNTVLEVRYTLDGNEWKSLGYVSEINNDIQFELPIEEFETIADLERLQIAVRTLSTFDVTPKIYLDAMWLDVEYGEILSETEEEELTEEILGQVIDVEEEEITEEEKIEQTLEDFPVLPVLSIRNFQKDILVDKEASHSCKSIPFKVNISGVDTYILPLVLEKHIEGLYELEIGSLPNGVDITFAKNNKYVYQPEANESEIDLKIINEAGSQKGDFNVSVVFSKKDMQDSSAICQINIINQ